MINNDIDKIVRKVVTNVGCLRLCLLSESSNFHGKETSGTLAFLIEKMIAEFEFGRQMIENKLKNEMLHDSLLDLSEETWRGRIKPRPLPNYVFLYFFEDLHIDTFRQVENHVFFYPLFEDYSSKPEKEAITRLAKLKKHLKYSGIRNPYLILLFPERMKGYIPEFHVFYERILLRLLSIPYPSLVVSKLSAPLGSSSLLGFPYSVIFKNMGVEEISFFMI